MGEGQNHIQTQTKMETNCGKRDKRTIEVASVSQTKALLLYSCHRRLASGQWQNISLKSCSVVICIGIKRLCACEVGFRERLRGTHTSLFPMTVLHLSRGAVRGVLDDWTLSRRAQIPAQSLSNMQSLFWGAHNSATDTTEASWEENACLFWGQ